MDFFKNKVVIAAIVVVVLILLGGGAYFVFASKKPAIKPVVQDQTIKNLSSSDIGLTLALSDDKTHIEIAATKLTGIEKLEGQFNYNALEQDPTVRTKSMISVPEGVVTSEDVKPGQDKVNWEVALGTCSSGTCLYPEITSDIQLIMKVTFKDGTLGQVTDTLKYPHSTNGNNQPQVAPDDE